MKHFLPELEKLTAQGRSRCLTLPMGIDFSSNDYLGLAAHPALRQAAIQALQEGIDIGATGSRLLRGHRQAHEDLEAFAATYFGCPRTLFFANGFLANYTLITTLITRDDIVIYDALCHASMRDGLHAAHCRTLKMPHNDLDAFEAALKQPRPPNRSLWVMVESIYSMEGDCAPISTLLNLVARYDAMLIVDEAHATGVLGTHGRGATEGLAHDRLITVHTCGKALGVAGALVCAADSIIAYLINTARPFIFSTAPMPLQALLVRRALELVRDEPDRRQQLHDLIAYAAQCLPTQAVTSPIIPIILGSDLQATSWASALQAQGFDVRAIRPPTVPEGTARLRLSLHVGLNKADIANVTGALTRLVEQRSCA